MLRSRAVSLGAVLVGAMLAAAIIAAVLMPPPSQAQPPGGKGGFTPPPPKVFVAPAIAADIADHRSFVGTVLPIRRSLVGSAVAGRVEEYLIDYGQSVTAGQPVAILRRQIIQAELDAAKGDLAMRVAELDELEKSLPDEIEQARAKVDEAQSLLDYRRIRADRSKALGAREAKEILEEDTALAAQAAAGLRDAQAALRILTTGAREQKTLQAKARVDVQTAQVQRLTDEFDRHTMVAPFDGFVSAEHTEVGQWLKQGDPVAEIVELRSVDVEIAVLEDYISGLDTTVVGQVEVSALPGQTFPGQVAMINPQADARARTFPVKVRVENQFAAGQPLIRAGMFARVSLPLGKPVTRTLVPKDAVVLGGQTPVVYVATGTPAKSAVKPVPVKLGLASGTWIAVSGEIQPGELVIVEGNERVQPGMAIRTEPKKMEQP